MVGIIVGSIIGGLAFIGILICGICCFGNKLSSCVCGFVDKLSSCVICSCFKFRKLKK